MRVEKPIGKYSRRQSQKYLKRGLLSLIPVILLYLTSITWLPTYIYVGMFETLRGLLAGICITLSAVYLWQPLYTWKEGLEGEEFVVRNLLRRLNDDYALFSDILLKDGKRGNIDHIIAGPTGIFVIETKNNKGRIVFDSSGWKGIIGDPIQQLFRNTLRVKDVLKRSVVFNDRELHVNAILVFSNPKIKLKLLEYPKYCSVIQINGENDTKLSELITNGSPIFSNQQIDLIEECIRSKIGNFEESLKH